MKQICYILSLLLAILENGLCVNTRFQERYRWNVLNFQFPNDQSRQTLVNNGEYLPNANVPLGIEIWRDRFFITVPRWIPGIISTLNYFRISAATTGSSPTLIPYPNFEANRIRENQTSYENNIVSVFRLKADACDRLWFVDNGIVDLAGTTRHFIAPRLFIIDLRTDRLIRRYTLGPSDAVPDTVFGGNIVVDVTADTCDRAYAYLPDFGSYRMVVYSFEQNQSWRIKHPYFYFDPFASPFYIGGLSFLWTDGAFGAALSPIQSDGFRILYFTSITSNYQFAVSTRYLRDRSIATNTSTLLQAYRFLGTRGPNMQTTAHMLDERTGVLFYTLINRNGIGCWNSIRNANNYSPDTNFVLATDDETMIFPNDIVLDDNNNVWLLSDRLPVSNIQGLSENNVNHRLFSAPIRDVIRGTVCDTTSSTGNSNTGSSGSRPSSGGWPDSNSGGSNTGSGNRNPSTSGGGGYSQVGTGSLGSGDNVNFPNAHAGQNLNSGLRVDTSSGNKPSKPNQNRPGGKY